MQLLFIPQAFPRTTTRKTWREADRWRRVVQKKLRAHMDDQIKTLVEHGDTMPAQVKQDMMFRLTNPPLLLGPQHSI